MSNLLKLLRFPIISDTSATREVCKWMNFVAIPFFFLFAGLFRVWATATTPFEEFLGGTVAVGFALLWPIFVSSLPRRKESP
jgi:hypothetical protein